MSIEKNRFTYIDIVKSLTMLLIIWAHIRLGDRSNAFAYAFHIPMFFFLSGMVFNKQRYSNFRDFCKKKMNSLLIPYLIFSIATWIFWAVFSYFAHIEVKSYIMPLLQTFLAQGSAGFLVHNVPLWFVPCLFVIEMIFWFLSYLSNSKILLFSFLLAALSFSLINYCTIVPVTLTPWSLDVALLGIPFYAAGYLLVTKVGHVKLQEVVLCNSIFSVFTIIICFILVYVGSGYNGSISFGHADLGRNVFVTYSCAFIGIVMMLTSCILVSKCDLKYRGLEKYLEMIKWFGRNSFYAMSIHKPLLGFSLIFVDAIFKCGKYKVSDYTTYSMAAFVITLLSTIIGIYLINLLLTKCKSINVQK